MTVAVVSAYVETAILLTVGLGLGTGLLMLAERIAGPQRARPWLKLARTLLLASLALPPIVSSLVRPNTLYRAPVQVWSGDSGKPSHVTIAGLAPLRGPGEPPRAPLLESGLVAALALGLVAASALGLARLALQVARLRRLCAQAVPIHRSGVVRVCVSDRTEVPFSAWTGRRVYVVIPERFVLEPRHLRIALAHELAHVRSGDLGWALAVAALRAILPWHPAAHLWARWLSRLEELACDERVLDRRRIGPGAYGECLLWAAEAALDRPRPFDLAVPMLDRSRTFLERRIAMLFRPPALERPRWMPVIAISSLLVLGVTAAIAGGTVADRRLDAVDVQRIADDLARTSGFHIIADESIVKEINSIVGREGARAQFREGLARLEAYRTVGGEALRRKGLPIELLAIAQTESRVQSLPEDKNPMRSAGIWQFIPSTARRYGLRVDETKDERMDPARSAEAAAAYLADLHDEFKDWRLAIAAYNAGEEKVRRAMEKTGTNDPVALARAGTISRYASAVLASALLVHDPRLLE